MHDWSQLEGHLDQLGLLGLRLAGEHQGVLEYDVSFDIVSENVRLVEHEGFLDGYYGGSICLTIDIHDEIISFSSN